MSFICKLGVRVVSILDPQRPVIEAVSSVTGFPLVIRMSRPYHYRL